MSERIKMIGAWLGGDYGISELAAEYGISRKTAYKWIERYVREGAQGLHDQSRAPRHHRNAVAEGVEQALLELKSRRPLWGAPKLRHKLQQALGKESCPAESTVSEILRRHGLSRVARRRRRAVPSAQPFAACQGANAVWWVRLGIGLERIEPGQPQQNGRYERMQRTLKAATTPAQANGRRQQESFDAFRREYNEERPHEALGQRTPAELYVPSLRDYPERLPQPRGYPDDWQKRKVRPSGQIKWKGRNLQISQALIGHEIGFKPVDNGQWTLYFEGLELGAFDERLHRLHPSRRLTFTPSSS